MRRLVLATRRSALALAQSRAFARALEATVAGIAIDELLVVTSGDKTQDVPLADIGGKGLFIKELEQALLTGEADFAVHSIKDVPAQILPGLTLSCIPKREDPRDAFVSASGATLAELAPGSRIGTSSLRRALCLSLARPDLRVEPLRGNVDTRLRKVEQGTLDGAVLALAGLRRLGLEDRVTERLSPDIMLPAVGQGALGIESARNDALEAILATQAHSETAVCVHAERAVMEAAEGSCRLPIAAYAVKDGERLHLRALLAEGDLSRPRRGERRIGWPGDDGEDEARRVGLDLGRELRLRERSG